MNWLKRIWMAITGMKRNVTPPAVVPVVTGATTTVTTTELTGAITTSDAGFVLGQTEGLIVGELPMIMDAIKKVNTVVKSTVFRNEMIASRFTETEGLTNQEIYDKFTKSKITVNVSMFTGSWRQNHVYRTVGFDDEGDDFVHANRYFVDDSSTLASLILHEIAHSLGFSHSSSTDYTSVPYMMNSIYDTCAERLGIK